MFSRATEKLLEVMGIKLGAEALRVFEAFEDAEVPEIVNCTLYNHINLWSIRT